MKSIKLLPTFAIIFFSILAKSEEMELFCQGSTSGTNITKSQREFILKVDKASGEMWGMPRFVVPMCELPTDKEFISHNCEASKNQFKCVCASTNGSTNMELSRVSGKLAINSLWILKNVTWNGNFNCDQIQARKF